MDQISLNYEASAGDTHKQVVASLPPEVVQCLENARFVRSSSSCGPRHHPISLLPRQELDFASSSKFKFTPSCAR